MEEFIRKNLEKWNNFNGYNIEEIIKGLGYVDNDVIGNNIITIKTYTNSNTSLGNLIISEDLPPIFMSQINGKTRTIIIFKKDLQILEYVDLPDRRLGAIELGLNLDHPYQMEFYNEFNRQYRYSINSADRKRIKPDVTRLIDKKEPISIINGVNLWTSEIRRSLAPQNNITIKKTL